MSQEDISGDNNFSQTKPWKEEIFATTKVLYAGQAVGKGFICKIQDVSRNITVADLKVVFELIFYM